MKHNLGNKLERNIEIAALSTKEVLLSVFDIMTPFYEATHTYRQPIRKYINYRTDDREKFLERISYLRRMGYIEDFTQNKEKFIELTPKGIKHLKIMQLDDIKISSTKWDQNWRVIIFDIPEKYKSNRDIFRKKLIELKFIQIQKSVYVYPFECTNEITWISQTLDIKKYVTIMIANIIQGEDIILDRFLSENILQKSDLVLNSKK